MSQIFGKTISIEFDGPYYITRFNPPSRAAIYVILIAGDTVGDFEPIYFDEIESLTNFNYQKHHAYRNWKVLAGSDVNLLISIHEMPNSNREVRERIKLQLIMDYKPKINMNEIEGETFESPPGFKYFRLAPDPDSDMSRLS